MRHLSAFSLRALCDFFLVNMSPGRLDIDDPPATGLTRGDSARLFRVASTGVYRLPSNVGLFYDHMSKAGVRVLLVTAQ